MAARVLVSEVQFAEPIPESDCVEEKEREYRSSHGLFMTPWEW
jgi:hypothetical protein